MPTVFENYVKTVNRPDGELCFDLWDTAGLLTRFYIILTLFRSRRFRQTPAVVVRFQFFSPLFLLSNVTLFVWGFRYPDTDIVLICFSLVAKRSYDNVKVSISIF